MGFFGFLFNEKVEEQPEVEIVEEESEEEKEVYANCEYCKIDIMVDEKRKHFDNKDFHRKCFKKFMKSAERFAFG